MSLSISSVFSVLSPFPFLILLTWMFSLCLLVGLGKGLCSLLTFSNTHLCFIDSEGSRGIDNGEKKRQQTYGSLPGLLEAWPVVEQGVYPLELGTGT